MMTPAHSQIGPPPLAYPISPVPGVNNHQPWAPSPIGSNARPSVSFQTSSLESAALSHEELQNTLQSVARALQLGNKLVQRAQPLLEMSPEARNMAILLLALQTCITPKPTPNPVVVPAQLPAKPTATQPPTDQQFSSAFRTWVQETTRWVLLAKDLQSYGSQASRRLRVADTPFTWVQIKFHVDCQIHSDKPVTPGAKIQICYIRFMANLNWINQRHQTLNRQKSFWDDIDEDLARLRRKSSAYGVAYSQLIFNLDQATWTGEKTINNVEEAAQQVPPHKEVHSCAATLVEEPNEEVALKE
ncbi:hypothetical protein PTTG_25671 [Puccinia triticina 1-1 BBBD Race 1]|uniref:Uncharacterized protein n=1 Tax=Puccinia triticina (isolate 1-1 / race 1 (BBBD)) TaxID=630390 RepID=A0A180H054_PUCT1|nr:hypothetical protein PTTG_25671 [Puccinia triticina 1-1 BBBD Race 1]